MKKNYRILCINPGSTSTKLACFEGEKKLDETNYAHDPDSIKQFSSCIEQLPMRREVIDGYIRDKGIDLNLLDGIAVRGGPNGVPYQSGAYRVDEAMVRLCRDEKNMGHPMCLGPLLADLYTGQYDIPAFNYDVVMVDELMDISRITGIPEIRRTGNCHVLNTKAVARELCSRMGKKYEETNIIMVHLGGGCSTSIHAHGRIIDAVASGDGTFSPSRCGKLPFRELIGLCFSGKFTEKQLMKYLSGAAGFVAYTGTSDMRAVESLIVGGDEQAKLIYDAFVYNIAKDVAAMSVAVNGSVDFIGITGGIAYSEKLIAALTDRIGFLAPVYVYPGAIEMEALAYGVCRVLDGEEVYHIIEGEDRKWKQK